MDDNSQKQLTLVQAVQISLDQQGNNLLRNSSRFRGILLDHVDPESPDMKLVLRYCDDEVLEPFVAAACDKESPTIDDLRTAAFRSASILVEDRTLDEALSRRVVNQLTEGIARHLRLAPPRAQQPPATPPDTPSNVRHVDVVSVPPRGSVSPSETGRATASKTAPQPAQAPSPTVIADETEQDFMPDLNEPNVPQKQPPQPSETQVQTPSQPQSQPQPPEKPVKVKDKEKTKARLRILAIIGGVAAVLLVVALVVNFGFRSTVRFDGNGQNSGSISNISTWNNSTVTLPENSFKRKGYAFAGWMREGNKEDLYQPGDTVTIDKSTTFVASWDALASFDGNDADSGKVESIRISGKDAITLPKNAFKRDGYRFGGWSLKADGSKPVKAETEVDVSNKPVTYYASWRPVIKYDGNGADSGEVKSIAASPSGKFTLPKSAYKRSGYRFVGWSTSKTGKPTKAGEKMAVDSPSTIYAIWRAVLKYDGNGAPGGKTDSSAADADGKTTLSECGYSWPYHTFKGWSTSSSGTASYQAGDDYSFSSPTTLYAIWELDTTSIVEKLDVEVIDREWEHGEHRSRMLLIRNDSDTTLDISTSFSCKDSSGSEVDTTTDSYDAVGPGQTVLMSGGSQRTDVASIDHEITVSEPTAGRSSLWEQVNVEEVTVEYGNLVLRVTNNSSKTATLWRIRARGLGSGGGETVQGKSLLTTLAPGTSTEITLTDNGSGWQAEWPAYYSRNYYLDGYLS